VAFAAQQVRVQQGQPVAQKDKRRSGATLTNETNPAEVIVAGRVLMDDPKIKKLLRAQSTSEWGAIQKARAIAKLMLWQLKN